MTENPPGGLFYGTLASWWPLISPPAEYEEEATEAAQLLESGSGIVHEVLELGSGGGNNAFHLKARFAMTLVDLSESMLQTSQALNPDCEHYPGDMRTIRLGRTFDAVFVHDAVDYMLSETDLRQAMDTAHAHCRAGGVAVFVPDATTETFAPGSECGGSDGADGRGARYLAWTWDPDPADTQAVTEYAFILREADGSVHLAHETHRTGLFSREVWLRCLADAGFVAELVTEKTTEDRTPRDQFIGRRPVP
jgi:trans-aconitate methyltransferase